MLYFSRLKIAIILTVCIIATLIAIPTFLNDEHRAKLPDFLSSNVVNLGLDLQGGSHLLLELDFDAYLKDQLANITDEIRTKLRNNKIGYRSLASADGKVKFSLRDMDGTDIAALIREIDPDLETSNEGANYTVAFTERALQIRKQQIMAQSLEIVKRRVDETGTREPIIQRQGEDRILLQVPGLDNPEHLKNLLGRTAKLTFHLLDNSVTPQDIEAGIVPPGTRLIMGDEKTESNNGKPIRYPVLAKVMLGGDSLVDASATFDQQSGQPVVSFRFNAAGAKIFGEITAQNVGKPFAVVLDNRVVTAPVIRSAILGGSGIISGNFTTQSANDLALLLRAGALPAPLTVVEERTVGPSLGNDSIMAGTKACLVGVVLVMLFMFINYGIFGILSDIALIVNGILIFAFMALFGATLTLPGIAGVVLTLGMAVDTNVLIYERMREEKRNGKSLMASIESGFKMAFGTIIDSHLTTFTAALLLYIFGTGTVKGFAVTLSVGIAASLFTAVLFTRMLIVLWLRRNKPRDLPI